MTAGQEPPVDGMHVPDRPSWWCRGCRLSWPCAVARQQLRRRYAGNRKGLAVLMGACLVDAGAELDLAPAELFRRFVAWTRYDGRPGEVSSVT